MDSSENCRLHNNFTHSFNILETYFSILVRVAKRTKILSAEGEKKSSCTVLFVSQAGQYGKTESKGIILFGTATNWIRFKTQRGPKTFTNISICWFRTAVLWILNATEVHFCFEFELLKAQNHVGWFTLYQRRAEKVSSWRNIHFCHTCSRRHRHRHVRHKMTALTVVFLRFSNVTF